MSREDVLRATLPTLAMVSGVFGLIFASSGCLSLDTDRACGEGEPPCYQNEVCYEGRCYEPGNVPSGADASEDEDEDARTPPRDSTSEDGGGNGGSDGDIQPGGDADTMGRDTGTDTTGRDTGTADTPDGGPVTRCAPRSGGGDAGPAWPDSAYCQTLVDRTNSNDLCGLEAEWARSSSADAGGADAGDAGSYDPPPRRPGARCERDSECLGRCEDVDGQKRCIHRMFTTTKTFDGAFEAGSPPDSGYFGVEEADCACQLLALRAGYEGRFQAIIRDGDLTVPDRIEVRTDIYATHFSRRGNWQATRLYDKSAEPKSFDSVGFWENAPEYNEQGDQIDTSGNDSTHLVWTGFRPANDDYDVKHCSFWSSGTASGDGKVGSLIDDSISRFRRFNRDCDKQYRLYCIEQ